MMVRKLLEKFQKDCNELYLSQFSEEETENLRSLIEMKNMFGVEQLLQEKNISKELKEIFMKLSTHFGSIETIHNMKNMTKNARAILALERLEQFYEALCIYQKESYISFDLGMLSKYHYYTGVIFKAYTYGVGDAIVKGGRYDKLLDKFGKNSPAIGFVILIDDLMSALLRQNISVAVNDEIITVSYSSDEYDTALRQARLYRSQGKRVRLVSK